MHSKGSGCLLMNSQSRTKVAKRIAGTHDDSRILKLISGGISSPFSSLEGKMSNVASMDTRTIHTLASAR